MVDTPPAKFQCVRSSGFDSSGPSDDLDVRRFDDVGTHDCSFFRWLGVAPQSPPLCNRRPDGVRAAAMSNPCGPIGEADEGSGFGSLHPLPCDGGSHPSSSALGDSTQAMRDFASSEWCDCAIDASVFATPVSTQSYAIPDVSSLLNFLTAS